MGLVECSFCGGEIKEEQVRVDLRCGEKLLVFDGVPAAVCQQCGEQYYRPEVYDYMASIAYSAPAPKSVITVPVYEYASDSGP